MHHTKNFSKYPARKKMWLIVALIGKFVVFGAVFSGLVFLLKDYTSPAVLLGLVHVTLLACVIAFFFIHKRKKHEEECECEVK